MEITDIHIQINDAAIYFQNISLSSMKSSHFLYNHKNFFIKHIKHII